MGDLEAWGEIGKNYKIHEETLSYFQKMGKLFINPPPALPVWNPEPEEFRAHFLRTTEVMAGNVADFDGSEKEIIIPTSGDGDKGVPVSVYKPHDISNMPTILVYFHGGGLVVGSRNVYATVLKLLARRAGCIVVNVEYRLAPEHKVPAAFDDCRDVTRWVLQNKCPLGGDQGSQVGVGGDSAGGHLVCSIAHDVDDLAFQIMVYPQTDLTLSAPSYSEFFSTPGYNTESIHWILNQYLENDAQKTDPVICPYLRPSFTGLPPALCILAELDPLRDDGLAYFDKLKNAEVATDVLLVKGAPHGFFHVTGHFKELNKEPYDRIVRFLKQFQQ